MTSQPDPYIIQYAVAQAGKSPCQKSKRGVCIFNLEQGVIISSGFNSPSKGAGSCTGTETCRKNCSRVCVHAEQAALLQAMSYGCRITGLDMMHIKVVGGQPVEGGPPSCSDCSKLILASGIRFMWLLETGRGWVRYSAKEFHMETLRNCGLLEKHGPESV